MIQKRRKQKPTSGGCQSVFSSQSHGGGGGGAFTDEPSNCGAKVKKILIRSGERIDAIQITYKYPNGQIKDGKYFGGNGGGRHMIDINVDKGEKIVGVFGRSGLELDQLGFITNTGKIFGPYGATGGGPFKVESCVIRGIYGRSGGLIDSIGFRCSRP